MKEKLVFVAEWLIRENVTNWHWNDTYLEYCEKFLPIHLADKKCKKDFAKVMAKAYELGWCKRAVRIGLGAGSYVNEWGTRTQTIWESNIIGKEYILKSILKQTSL